MAKRDEDAAMEATAAPLMEHLVELRKRMIWAIAAFFVAFLVSFALANQIFNLLVVPFQWAAYWHDMGPS